ncbi:DUF397 domain-containing protein [Nonomuraea sp. LPB2021202275-12-8]|uniref:DUF397 domain-containing protein n=1 Tax=Nonomuraea sp. LPB2021202275-12-8 TaxID=3120159 RepID=UPI00300D16D1
MIIMNQGVAVIVPDDAEWRRYTNGGGNCVDVTSVTLPADHPKHGQGRAVALRDSEDPGGPVLVFVGPELRSFAAGLDNGTFDDLV